MAKFGIIFTFFYGIILCLFFVYGNWRERLWNFIPIEEIKSSPSIFELNNNISGTAENFENVENESLPIVLFWTRFFEEDLKKKFITNDDEMKNCPVKCRYSSDRKLYSQSKVAVFHNPDISQWEIEPKTKNSSTKNVFFVLESQLNSPPNAYNGLSFFNLTMTFKTNSDILMPYDRFVPITNTTLPTEIWSEKEIDLKITKKKKLGLSFVSNCHTRSLREMLLSNLKFHLNDNMTIYGKCFRLNCTNSGDDYHSPEGQKCIDDAIDEHYFYFAFENSICLDYVTEKFWRLKKLIVPIVLKRKIVSPIVNDSYFIAVDDFKNPTQLIAFLQNLIKNPAEYKKYFSWTKLYKKTNENQFGTKPACELCKFAHQNQQRIIPDITKFWDWKQCKRRDEMVSPRKQNIDDAVNKFFTK